MIYKSLERRELQMLLINLLDRYCMLRWGFQSFSSLNGMTVITTGDSA
jgi:hypothetical protein